MADDVAKTVRRTARALVEICQVLHGTGVGDWEGKAAAVFREKFDDDFRPRMDEARDSFQDAASALEDWADYMKEKQGAAVRLERQAAELDEQLGRAHEKADKLGKADSDKKDTQQHKDEVQAANRAVNAKELELDELRRSGRTLARNYQGHGKEIANRLKKAMDIAPDEPGVWDKLGDAISDLGKALADLPGQVGELLAEVGHWIKEHADWITVIASVVGVVAIFCPVLAPLAIGLSAVAFIAHAAKYQAEGGLFPPCGKNAGNWLTLGGDLLGMVPGVGAVKTGIQAGVKAGRGAGGLANGTKVGINTAAKVAKNEMKGADLVANVIDKPVMAAASKLGLSRGAALTATEVTQAAAQTAWTVPTALNAWETSDGRADAATWGTGIGNITTAAPAGMGGKGATIAGGVFALGSTIGLGAWELTD
ncbi:putative T7SS-secreted protein [Streptomyces poriticola]|uniref:putative T7SS-secreted protein n=1 Tax=Streptomyces poriticola TaxID=3120506 RepID=UPI002FCE399F